MVLADGMGYGGEAERDSGSLIETLEHLLEAGFEKADSLAASGIRCWWQNTKGNPLRRWIWCRWICTRMVPVYQKSSAAAAYLYRDGQVEVIEAQSLPVGVSVDTGCDVVKRQLKPEIW